MKLQLLRRMLEWHVEVANEWNLRAGARDNWNAMFATIDLFRRIAQGVARELEFTYPQALDDRVCAYLDKIRDLKHP